MDRSVLLGLLALVVALTIEVLLVMRTPGLGFLGAGMAVLGAAVMVPSLLLGKHEALDVGYGLALLGAVVAVFGAGAELFLSLTYQVVPAGLFWVGRRISDQQQAKRHRTWADEFLARQAERDNRRP